MPDWSWLLTLIQRLPRPTPPSIALAFQHPSHALATLHSFVPALDRALAAAAPAVVLLEFEERSAPRELDEDEETLLERFEETRSQGILRVQGMLYFCDIYS